MKSQLFVPQFCYQVLTDLRSQMLETIDELIEDLAIDWSDIRSGVVLFDGSRDKYNCKIYTLYQNPNTGITLVWNVSGKVLNTDATMSVNSHQGNTIWQDNCEVWKGPLDYQRMLLLGVVKNKALERS